MNANTTTNVSKGIVVSNSKHVNCWFFMSLGTHIYWTLEDIIYTVFTYIQNVIQKLKGKTNIWKFFSAFTYYRIMLRVWKIYRYFINVFKIIFNFISSCMYLEVLFQSTSSGQPAYLDWISLGRLSPSLKCPNKSFSPYSSLKYLRLVGTKLKSEWNKCVFIDKLDSFIFSAWSFSQPSIAWRYVIAQKVIRK